MNHSANDPATASFNGHTHRALGREQEHCQHAGCGKWKGVKQEWRGQRKKTKKSDLKNTGESCGFSPLLFEEKRPKHGGKAISFDKQDINIKH